MVAILFLEMKLVIPWVEIAATISSLALGAMTLLMADLATKMLWDYVGFAQITPSPTVEGFSLQRTRSPIVMAPIE